MQKGSGSKPAPDCPASSYLPGFFFLQKLTDMKTEEQIRRDLAEMWDAVATIAADDPGKEAAYNQAAEIEGRMWRELHKANAESQKRAFLVAMITNLWPADSEYEDTAEVGQEFLAQAIQEALPDWREMPLAVLEAYARKCTTREFSGYPEAESDRLAFWEQYRAIP